MYCFLNLKKAETFFGCILNYVFRLPTETGDEITSRLRKQASEKKGNSLEDRFQHLYSHQESRHQFRGQIPASLLTQESRQQFGGHIPASLLTLGEQTSVQRTDSSLFTHLGEQATVQGQIPASLLTLGEQATVQGPIPASLLTLGEQETVQRTDSSLISHSKGAGNILKDRLQTCHSQYCRREGKSLEDRLQLISQRRGAGNILKDSFQSCHSHKESRQQFRGQTPASSLNVGDQTSVQTTDSSLISHSRGAGNFLKDRFQICHSKYCRRPGKSLSKEPHIFFALSHIKICFTHNIF